MPIRAHAQELREAFAEGPLRSIDSDPDQVIMAGTNPLRDALI
jgi:hypothetical protein